MNEKEKLKETLSALFDNEAGKVDQLELRRLVRSLDDNPDLIETYQRYVLMRATLKGEPLPIVASALLDNIRVAVDQETMEEPAAALTGNKNSHVVGKSNPGWLKSLGRVAIAASVAVVAVYVIDHQSVSMTNTVAMQMPAVNATPNTVEISAERNNRLLNPEVMTVSAGDRRPFEKPVENTSKASSGCALSSPRADNSDLVWEKELPSGYVLCKQGLQSGQCESMTSKIGCYLN